MTQQLPDNEKMVRVWFRCKPDLLVWIGQQAKKENRPRSSMIERMLFRAFTEQLKAEKATQPSVADRNNKCYECGVKMYWPSSSEEDPVCSLCREEPK